MSHKIILMVGQKGTGKTWLARKLAIGLFHAGRRVFLIDPHDEMLIPGIMKTSDPGDMAGFAGRSVRCVPYSDTVVDRLFRFVWHLQKPGRSLPSLWLFVDELPMYMDARSPWASLMTLVRYGRNRRVSIVGTAQRVASVHNDFIANTDVKILFRVQEVNDLAYLRRYIGNVADLLSSLPDRSFLRVG